VVVKVECCRPADSYTLTCALIRVQGGSVHGEVQTASCLRRNKWTDGFGHWLVSHPGMVESSSVLPSPTCGSPPARSLGSFLPRKASVVARIHALVGRSSPHSSQTLAPSHPWPTLSRSDSLHPETSTQTLPSPVAIATKTRLVLNLSPLTQGESTCLSRYNANPSPSFLFSLCPHPGLIQS
jgi:hypothetical protein